MLNLHYHSMGLGTPDGVKNFGGKDLPIKASPTIMRVNGHGHLALLKKDIGRDDHEILQQFNKKGWPSVGQLRVEVHLERSMSPFIFLSNKGYSVNSIKSLDALFNHIEAANVRSCHLELNWKCGALCYIDHALFQDSGRPDKKNYSMYNPVYNDALASAPE